MDKNEHLKNIRNGVEEVDVRFQMYVACPSTESDLNSSIRNLGLTIAHYQQFLAIERLKSIGIEEKE